MLYVHLILTLMLYEFLYVPGACDGDELDEALEIQVDGLSNSQVLCPPETKRANDKLDELSTRFVYVLKYCLFHKIFTGYGEKLCLYDMKPIFKLYFRINQTIEKIQCGSRADQFLHFFGYFYCGKMNEGLQQLQRIENSQDLTEYNQTHAPKDIPMYDVCYDMGNIETTYTKHKIWNPAIYLQPDFQENPYSPTEISTDSFYLRKERILKIKEFYDREKKKNPNTRYRMFPHPMVPPQHFALPTLKRTTNNYINMAPLWEDLIPLMNVIDEGIKIAARKVFRPAGYAGEEPEELLIFTQVVQLPKRQYSNVSTGWKKLTYQPNIWHKFIYNKKRMQGVIIYIHNTPEGRTEENSDESQIMPCDFQSWWSPPETSSESSSEPINFNFAYCCRITAGEANRLFSENFTIENVLDINSIITSQENVVQNWDTEASFSQTHEFHVTPWDWLNLPK